MICKLLSITIVLQWQILNYSFTNLQSFLLRQLKFYGIDPWFQIRASLEQKFVQIVPLDERAIAKDPENIGEWRQVSWNFGMQYCVVWGPFQERSLGWEIIRQEFSKKNWYFMHAISKRLKLISCHLFKVKSTVKC